MGTHEPMTNTRKFVAAAGLGVVLALSSAGTALAGCEGPDRAPVTSGMPNAFSGGGGTTCINEGGAYASGVVTGSPGVLSGNQIQIPISIPINICGNSVNLVGIGNGTGGGNNGGGGNN